MTTLQRLIEALRLPPDAIRFFDDPEQAVTISRAPEGGASVAYAKPIPIPTINHDGGTTI